MDKEISIQFDYECIDEGHFIISYIPLNRGDHIISVKYEGRHIGKSPYIVSISETLEELNKQGRARITQETGIFEKRTMIEESSIESSEAEHTPTSRTHPPSLQRSLTSIGKVPLRNRVISKRILRKFITETGQEILIEDATSTTPCTRQASVESYSSCPPVVTKPLKKEKFPSINPLKLIANHLAAVIVKQSVFEANKIILRSQRRRRSSNSELKAIHDGLLNPKTVKDKKFISSPFSTAISDIPSFRPLNYHRKHRRLSSNRSLPLELYKSSLPNGIEHPDRRNKTQKNEGHPVFIKNTDINVSAESSLTSSISSKADFETSDDNNDVKDCLKELRLALQLSGVSRRRSSKGSLIRQVNII